MATRWQQRIKKELHFTNRGKVHFTGRKPKAIDKASNAEESRKGRWPKMPDNELWDCCGTQHTHHSQRENEGQPDTHSIVTTVNVGNHIESHSPHSTTLPATPVPLTSTPRNAESVLRRSVCFQESRKNATNNCVLLRTLVPEVRRRTGGPHITVRRKP